MKAAYLNDEQIVKAVKSAGGLDFNLGRLASELKVMSHSDKHKNTTWYYIDLKKDDGKWEYGSWLSL